MEKKISNILSVVLHPLLVPSFFVLIIFHLPVYFIPLQFIRVKYMILLYVFLMTAVIPVLVAFILWRLKLINSLKMGQRNDRIFPLMTMAVIYYLTYYLLNKQGAFPIMNLFLVGSSMLALITLLINIYAKISMHLVSWGGFTGALMGLSFLFHLQPFFWIILVLFLSGLAGYARLKGNAHKPWQVYVGYILGFAMLFALFLIA